MKSILIVLLLPFIGGCAQLIGASPTFQHCNEVNYNRKGADIIVSARCQATLGRDGLL